MTEFDPLDYARKKNRDLEQRLDGCRRERDRLIRLIALVAEVAVGQTGVDPLKLIAIAEAMEEAQQQMIEQGVSHG